MSVRRYWDGVSSVDVTKVSQHQIALTSQPISSGDPFWSFSRYKLGLEKRTRIGQPAY